MSLESTRTLFQVSGVYTMSVRATDQFSPLKFILECSRLVNFPPVFSGYKSLDHSLHKTTLCIPLHFQRYNYRLSEMYWYAIKRFSNPNLYGIHSPLVYTLPMQHAESLE